MGSQSADCTEIDAMPLFVIPFPAFDPVLVHLGPFAIRWYALAYIAGILLGWLYARALIRNEKLWGGPAPLTRRRLRRLRALGHARHHPGRAHRLCAVLQSAAFHRASDRDHPALARRHVVPRRLYRLRAGGRAVRAQARHFNPLARRHHLRGRADRIVPRPHRQFHQRRIVGPAGRRPLGDDFSRRRAGAAPSEPAL